MRAYRKGARDTHLDPSPADFSTSSGCRSIILDVSASIRAGCTDHPNNQDVGQDTQEDGEKSLASDPPLSSDSGAFSSSLSCVCQQR